jgi:predicted transcriptional regulator
MAEEKKKYKVKLPEGKEEGVYANAASVHFNSNECIVDMAYVIPNASEPILKVVSRVNMSHKTAESFLKVLSNAILDFKNKNKDKE